MVTDVLYIYDMGSIRSMRFSTPSSPMEGTTGYMYPTYGHDMLNYFCLDPTYINLNAGEDDLVSFVVYIHNKLPRLIWLFT